SCPAPGLADPLPATRALARPARPARSCRRLAGRPASARDPRRDDPAPASTTRAPRPGAARSGHPVPTPTTVLPEDSPPAPATRRAPPADCRALVLGAPARPPALPLATKSPLEGPGPEASSGGDRAGLPPRPRPADVGGHTRAVAPGDGSAILRRR